MAYAKIRKAKDKQRDELTWTAAAGVDADVDFLELTPDGTRVSITRELPAWGNVVIVGLRVAIEGVTSSAFSFSGVEFGVGFCTSYAKRYGEATEYALMAGIPATRTSTYTPYEDPTNRVPAPLYYYSNRPVSLWNAGSSTVSGTTNYISPPVQSGFFKSGGAAGIQHASYNYAPMMVFMRRTGANQILFGFRMVGYPHVCVPRENYLSGLLDGQIISPETMAHQAWNELAALIFSVNSTYGASNTFTVDEATHGVFNHFNIAFNHPTARLLVRDIVCVQNVGGTVYPL